MVCPVARSLYEIYENRPPNAIDMIRYAVATMMYWAETSPARGVIFFRLGPGLGLCAHYCPPLLHGRLQPVPLIKFIAKFVTPF